jgi:hypothetical protein
MTLLILNILYYAGILTIVKKLAEPVDEKLKADNKSKKLLRRF